MLLALLFSVITLVLFAPVAFTEQAQLPRDIAWGITPAANEHGGARTSFTYEARGGETIHDAVWITNHGAEVLKLRVYGADGTTTASGDLTLQGSDEPSTSVGAWVQPETSNITVAPGETETLHFTVTVPENIAPGDHMGGIVTSLFSAETAAVALDQRIATRMIVSASEGATVSADIRNVDLGVSTAWNPFAPVNTTIRLDIANTGNTLIRNEVAVTSNSVVSIADTQRIQESDELLPEEHQPVEMLVPVWPRFTQAVEIQLTPVSTSGVVGEVVHESVTVVAIPWGQIAVLVLIGAAVSWYLVHHRRVKRDRQTASVLQ
ncbi:WxL protein peptidoglycan domain-containing protein [Yaniella sp.]|uniref:WxL protein peptidoglycan domain-containing protein n=1 Tax=Yaniella sp. TaxID=2773929 RepID=UPI003F950993